MSHVRRPASTRPDSPRLPNGRLSLDVVLPLLQEDGLIEAKEALRARGAAKSGKPQIEVHPLVLLSNLKLASHEKPAPS
jgi:general secretion pathway protein E